MRTLNILGSTGSIGQSTLKVVKAHADKFKIGVLTAQSRVDLLIQQAIEFKASKAVIGDEALYAKLKEGLSGYDIECAAGEKAIEEAGSILADITMAAIVGMAGLPSLMRAIEQGNIVAIANKEPLVAAGPLVMAACQEFGTTLLPVDSEHNAVFQVFEQSNKASIEKIILTASGGPFREWPIEKIAIATPQQAINHPNWDMGSKISVDSASMMNKALEVIEAQRLFDVSSSQIEVLVHPQSVIHSMVEYSDGSTLCQMGASDMCTPITNVLSWPQRLSSPGDKLDLVKLGQLSFEEPDHMRFPAIKMAYESLNSGLASCITLNAANEVAVAAFLDHKIAFLDIYKIVSEALDKLESAPLKSLNDIVNYDTLSRLKAESIIEALKLKDVS